MDFGQLRNSLLLFYGKLLEKAQRTQNLELKELYLEASRHLKDVSASLYKFDQAMKRIREMENQKDPNA